ncbi:alpha/beta fold hydrolase [Streptomyces sp. JJ36]|uniref:alpha/beta fold hydrolase n=1 Tax=Streptomyces sp. JJ36 TaxID=2736645 RepID=UPI001F2A3CF3|nr:alpha/beta fold hydrolase [Streptomyces sp. JJ36]
MKSLPRKAASALFGPVPVTRDRAIGASERLSALTSLVSSLEHLTQRENIRPGGLNDWRIGRDVHVRSHRLTRRFLDLVADERTTTALHAARVAAAAGLLLPGSGKWRGAANLFLGLSNAALYPRHRYGTDGSDQVSTMVQTVTGLARLSSSPELKDTLLWYVALQANLSYVVSGWVKLLGEPWRDGSALGGIMRTRTYGHEGFWNLTRRHPVPARFLAHGVLALECLFPLAYARGGVLARPVIGAAASFHVANGFLMGLGRFVTSFTAMHPMVAYTSTPRSHPAVAGRDDRLLGTALVASAGALGAAAAVAGTRRMRAADRWPGSRELTTRHGNRLSYDLRVPGDPATPVLVFVPGMTSTAEHFGWITEKVVEESDYGLLTYNRAGYSASTYRGGTEFTLQQSVDDLVDLVQGALGTDRPVVVAGHSLGGEIARRAAAPLGDRCLGVVYLDSSHPGELNRSQQQSDSAKKINGGLRLFVNSLRAGMGALLTRPDWVDNLPAAYRSRAFAQYADTRMWTASQREWAATEKEFRAFDGELERVDAHALVLSAQRTVDRDPEQLLMHNELAAAHRGDGRVVRTRVLEGADHDTMLTSARLGTEAGRLLLEFVGDIAPDGGHAAGDSARETKEDAR